MTDNASPMLSRERLEELVDELGDEEIVQESLEMYAEQLPGRAQAIAALAEQDDQATVRATVHALGSPSAMLGITAIASVCQAAEGAAGTPEAAPLIEQIGPLSQQLQAELADLLDNWDL